MSNKEFEGWSVRAELARDVWQLAMPLGDEARARRAWNKLQAISAYVVQFA